MACSSFQILTILIGILNFILGLPILVGYFLLRKHEEWRGNYTGDQDRESWSVWDIVMCIVGLILLLILTSSSIGSVWSGFKSKYQELLARGAVILLQISAAIIAIVFVLMFILGYHWINLMPLLVWGVVLQTVFFLLIGCYVNQLTRVRGEKELTLFVPL